MNIDALKNLLKGSGQSRIRLIIVGAIMFVVVAYAVYHYGSANQQDAGDTSQLKGVSSQISSVPGSKPTSPQYLQLLEQSNQEAAQRALQTGQSDIPTLINTGNEQTSQSFTTGSCTAFCDQFTACQGCRQSETTGGILNKMVNAGDVAPDVAADLNKLAASGASPSDYAADLNRLVQQGRLTPDQAQKLLAAYRKEYANATPDNLVDQLLAGGKLTPDTAAEIKKLNNSGLTPDEYKAQLDELVKEGKLTPAQEKALLAAYQKRHKNLSPSDLTDQMLATGHIAPDTAAALQKLNSSGMSKADYRNALDKLVQEGKLTPAQAKELLEAYQRKHGQFAGTASAADRLAAAGDISPATASELDGMDNLSPDAYKKRLDELVKEGKLTPEQARELMAAYNAKHGIQSIVSPDDVVSQLAADGKITPDTAAILKKLNSENLTPDEYKKRLAQLVAEGKLTPEQAKQLLDAYKAKLANAAAAEAALSAQQQVSAPSETTGGTELDATADELSQKQAALNQALQQQLSQQEAAIKAQAQALVTAWNPVPQTVEGMMVEQPQQGAAATAGGQATANTPAASSTSQTSKAAAGGPLIKAGSIMFAVLDTAVNSDEPGPVMATIVEGPYKGVKLMGSLKTTEDTERVMLTFNTMIKDSWPENISMTAVAINPDTAHTALASDVNHHYLLKWGSLFASNFLSGVAQAITTSGSTTTSSSGTNTTSHPNFSAGKQALVGLGQVGTAFSKVAGKWQDLPNTVKVDAGVGMGLLFTADVPQQSFDVNS